MLTEQEREWLERRKCTCNSCAVKKCVRNCRGLVYGDCEWFEVKGIKGIMRENFRDAAEFEARVAQRLVRNMSWPCYVSSCPEGRGKDIDYLICSKEEWCHMKYARLTVEAEMDK